MSVNIASFIDRTDIKKTKPAQHKELKMPTGKDINIREVDADSQQNGVINNEISGNYIEQTFDFIQIHFNSVMSVLGIVVLIIGLCCIWRCLKMKNIRKITKFVCLKKCKVTEEMLEVDEKAQEAKRNLGADFELLDVNALVSMANRATVENAYLRSQQMRPTVEGANLSTC